MPNADRDSSAGAVLEALGFAVFIRDQSGALQLSGKSPDWLRAIWPDVNAPAAPLPIDRASPFLENFLVDAGECWSAGGEKHARSGPWIEHTADGTELSLEATALTARGQAILLLERLGEIFEKKKATLQKARETVIAYQRLNSEMQKKEILLNCISEEMNAALANVITSLRLIELEKSPVRINQLLGLASRATEEQQTLINKVLNVFAAELEGLHGRSGIATAEARLGDALQAAEDNVAPQFADKRVRLKIADNGLRETRVPMDSNYLTRVLSSLLENALQSSAAAGEVRLNLAEEPESLRLEVCDDGTPLPQDICTNLFSRTGAAKTEPHALTLPLQFCSIAIENCQGEFGFEPQDQGGNCFWVRLPKLAAPK